MCKVRGGILANNNFKDILRYIDEYNLQYTTTSDILVEALNNKIITKQEANTIWKKMLNNHLYLPNKTFDDYYLNRK